MKAKRLLWIPVIFFAVSACKKNEETTPAGDMLVMINKDTAFVTTDVKASITSTNTLYITGKSRDDDKKVSMTLSDYQRKKGNFLIDYRGTGGNIYGNTGQYFEGSNLTEARAGGIVITEVKGGLIKGNFTFYYQNTEIHGSFTSPAP